MTRFTELDDATVLHLERHETQAHAIPSREVRDLGDALVLFDPRDPDPFFNRMVSIRWPVDPVAFDLRLNEALAMFALLGRTPHVWPSPIHSSPPDLIERLGRHGFADVGRGHVMIHRDPAGIAPVRPTDLAAGVTIGAIRTPRDVLGDDLEAVGIVLAESFGADRARAAELTGDMRRTLDDERVTLVLARVDGEPAAAAKATTFDGFTYLSSIGTRPAFRGRGLARLVTRHAIGVSGRRSHIAYLGVWSGNEPALRVYEDLGFASIGESPDLLLE